MKIADETPIAMLTVGQLRAIIREVVVDSRDCKEEPPASMPDTLLTTNEACEFLRCSKPTLHRWKKEGIVPHIRIGANIRYRESDLVDILNSK